MGLNYSSGIDCATVKKPCTAMRFELSYVKVKCKATKYWRNFMNRTEDSMSV